VSGGGRAGGGRIRGSMAPVSGVFFGGERARIGRWGRAGTEGGGGGGGERGEEGNSSRSSWSLGRTSPTPFCLRLSPSLSLLLFRLRFAPVSAPCKTREQRWRPSPRQAAMIRETEEDKRVGASEAKREGVRATEGVEKRHGTRRRSCVGGRISSPSSAHSS